MDSSQIKALNDSDNDIRLMRMQPEQEVIFWDIIDREKAKISNLSVIEVSGEWAQGENKEVRERIFWLYLQMKDFEDIKNDRFVLSSLDWIVKNAIFDPETIRSFNLKSK